MKVFIKTYGCTFNHADSDRMAAILAAAGHETADGESDADVVVLNTCSVKSATQEKIRHRIAHARRPLVVAGCIAQVMPGFIERNNPSASIVGTFAQGRIADAVEAAAAGSKIRAVEDNGLPAGLYAGNGVFARVQINSGCASACSFCSTKLARGAVRSYRPSEIVEAVRKAVAAGAKEIQLASQDTGAYGLDCGLALPELLERVCGVEGEFRMRVGMLNPQHFLRLEKPLLEVFAGNGKLFKFFHIPFQSGSDRVLESMRRGYTAAQAWRAVEGVTAVFPDAVLGTDVIVGYPSETEGDFEETLEFLRKAEFDVVNVSKFSPRPGTPAARLKQLDNRVVKKRSEAASALARSLSLEKNRRFAGSAAGVLVTEKRRNGVSGRTDDYMQVVIPCNGAAVPAIGEFVKVELAEARTGCVIARRFASGESRGNGLLGGRP